jgi:hypothetical protein
MSTIFCGSADPVKPMLTSLIASVGMRMVAASPPAKASIVVMPSSLVGVK